MRRTLRNHQSDAAPVIDNVHRWLLTQPSLVTIAAFAALPHEVDLTRLLALHAHRRWVFPRVEGNSLIFHRIDRLDTDFQPGAYGIQEPHPFLEIIPPLAIDAFLCPGLAFDSRGGRLGQGRGFYDRLLANARPDALKVGVCFDFQRVPDTFREPHDIPMDLVIS